MSLKLDITEQYFCKKCGDEVETTRGVNSGKEEFFASCRCFNTEWTDSRESAIALWIGADHE